MGRQGQRGTLRTLTSLPPLVKKPGQRGLGLWSWVVTFSLSCWDGEEGVLSTGVCRYRWGVWPSVVPSFEVFFEKSLLVLFSRPDHLNGHIKQVHTSERPHKCQVGVGARADGLKENAAVLTAQPQAS